MALLETIISLLAKKAFDEVADAIKLKFGSTSCLSVSKNQMRAAISTHFTYVSNWSNTISFRDIEKAKHTLKTYIELDYLVVPQRAQFEVESPKYVNLDGIIAGEKIFLKSKNTKKCTT